MFRIPLPQAPCNQKILEHESWHRNVLGRILVTVARLSARASNLDSDAARSRFKQHEAPNIMRTPITPVGFALSGENVVIKISCYELVNLIAAITSSRHRVKH